MFISKAIRATLGGRGGSREEGRTQKSPTGLWQQQNPQPRRVCPDHLFVAHSSQERKDAGGHMGCSICHPLKLPQVPFCALLITS